MHEFGPHLFIGLEHPGPNLLEVETSFNRSTPVKVFSAFEGKTLWNVTGQTSEWKKSGLKFEQEMKNDQIEHVERWNELNRALYLSMILVFLNRPRILLAMSDSVQ